MASAEKETIIKISKMSNPRNTRTLIISKDGTPIPTCKKLNHSIDKKHTVALANLKSEKKSRVTEQSLVYEILLPFISRGLANWEIALILEPVLDREQIEKFAYRKTRPELNLSPKGYFTPEKATTRKSEEIIYSLRKNPDDQSPTDSVHELENEKKSIGFIFKFWRSGFFSTDISAWQNLKKLYQEFSRPLPEGNFDKLRLEVFLAAAQKRKDKGDLELLKKYGSVGHRMGAEWFRESMLEEEAFIKLKFAIAKKERKKSQGSEKKRENEMKQSIVWNKVGPLYERGLLNAEIEMLTGFNYQQVVRSIGQNKYRPEWNKVRISNDNSRRIGGWKLRKQPNLLLSDRARKSADFIKAFVALGLITKNTSKWQELKDLYQSFERPLPESNFDKLRLEIFLTAVERLEDDGDRKLLTLYNKLGSETEDKWFTVSLYDEESFIRSKRTAPGFLSLIYSGNDSPEKRKKIREIVSQKKHTEKYGYKYTS
jgi:hypothetical protein